MKQKNIIIVLTTLSLFVLASCFAPIGKSSYNQRAYSTNKNPFIYKMHPDFKFYHSASGNKLYIRFSLQEFMFAQFKRNEAAKAKITVKYFVYSPDDFENTKDSATFDFDLEKRKNETSAITYIPVREVNMKEYYIKIFTVDLLKRVASKNFIYVNYENENSSQNFMASYDNKKLTYFKNYIKADKLLDIQHNKNANKLFVRYMLSDFPPASPPYLAKNYKPLKFKSDSLYEISGGSKIKFRAKQKALYCIQTDTSSNNGFCIINAGKHLPLVRTGSDMLDATRYICKNQEFEDLQNSSNKKLALDRFWIKAGGNMNIARELIRIYYNRVTYSNIYFTSYKQGWKTDRGMIYIMFGTPKIVKKAIDKEVWIYSDKYNKEALQFVFNRQNSPYSDNVFVLERNADFMQFWAEAKLSWRSGKVYTVFM